MWIASILRVTRLPRIYNRHPYRHRLTFPSVDTSTLLELLRIVAWPITVLVVVFLFRKSVLGLLPTLREMKVMGAEFRFAASEMLSEVTGNGVDLVRRNQHETLRRL